MPVNIETIKVKASTETSMLTSSRRGMASGTISTRAWEESRKSIRPKAPPSAERSNASTSICRIKWLDFAPIAVRMAISFLRAAERASCKLATFAQAISNTKPTAASMMRSAGRMSW
jgi:hypothetical protein